MATLYDAEEARRGANVYRDGRRRYLRLPKCYERGSDVLPQEGTSVAEPEFPTERILDEG